LKLLPVLSVIGINPRCQQRGTQARVLYLKFCCVHKLGNAFASIIAALAEHARHARNLF
jgi:hypothetical protein